MSAAFQRWILSRLWLTFVVLGVSFFIFGAATVNLGSHLDGRVSMAWPLTASPQTQAGDLHLYFGVAAQF